MSKRHYIYIEAGALIDETSRFFNVAIGTTKQATRDYLFLMAHSVSHGFYFEPVSVISDNFLEKIAQSLSFSSVLELGVQHVDARCLVRSIKANVAMPISAAQLTNADYQRLMLDKDYRFMSELRKNNLMPAGSRRKT